MASFVGTLTSEDCTPPSHGNKMNTPTDVLCEYKDVFILPKCKCTWSKMADLKRKSIRMDHSHTTNLVNEYPWSWAPTRDIKIKKVIVSEDIPSTQGGTMWWWLSIGAAVFLNPTTDPNEEETIFALSHLRQETNVGLPAMNQSWEFDYGTDYVEVEEGEKIYLGVDGGTGQMVGFSIIIFYI